MEARQFEWEYFIDATTKAASPQFDELCRGLARVIVRSMIRYAQRVH